MNLGSPKTQQRVDKARKKLPKVEPPLDERFIYQCSAIVSAGDLYGAWRVASAVTSARGKHSLQGREYGVPWDDVATAQTKTKRGRSAVSKLKVRLNAQYKALQQSNKDLPASVSKALAAAQSALAEASSECEHYLARSGNLPTSAKQEGMTKWEFTLYWWYRLLKLRTGNRIGRDHWAILVGLARAWRLSDTDDYKSIRDTVLRLRRAHRKVPPLQMLSSDSDRELLFGTKEIPTID